MRKTLASLLTFTAAAGLSLTALAHDDGHGTCCDKAKAKGVACAHPCCAEATKAGKVCFKCNPAAKPADCCEKAAAAGKVCDKPCCVEATKAGKNCEKCKTKA